MSILLSLQAVGSQAADQMPDLTAVTLPTEAEINVIDLAFKGGWIMVVLLLLSLMAIYIFVQRLIIIRRAGKEDETFMNRIKDYIHEGKVDSALNLCRSTNTPSARMIEKGITRLGRPMNDVLVAIENVGNLEIAKLEKGFPLIATTAAGAPMLGFLGTVTGMVRAFYEQNCAMVVGTYMMTDFNMNMIAPGIIDHKEWTPDNGRNNALRINGLGAPRAFYTPVLREVKVPNTSYGEDYALGLNFSRQYQIGRVYDVVYNCRRWDDNSDASLDIVKMNGHNLYKDRIRTWELQARIAMNKKSGK